MPNGWSRVPASLVSEWAEAGVSRPALVLVLLLRYQHADEGGRLWGWYPRAEMAKVLHCSESTIKTAVRDLKRRGLIEVKEQGRHGRATTYWLSGPPGDAGTEP